MFESAKKKWMVASRLMNFLTRRVNTRGLSKEQQRYGLTKKRVIAIKFTDKDIRYAEKRGILERRSWKFYLSDDGMLVKVTDKSVEPDILMFLTLTTFMKLIKAQIGVQEAYRLRLLQTRYVNRQAEQEDDFLRDAGLVLKLMNQIQAEVLSADDL